MDGAACFRDELAEFASIEERPGGRRLTESRFGRPPLPGQLRTEPFSLRLTGAEREVVAAAAARAGARTAATWARLALTEAARNLLAEESAAPRP